MNLNIFLDKWRINKSILAEKLGLTPPAFYNKLSEKNADKLTEQQKKALSELIKDLANDASKVEI